MNLRNKKSSLRENARKKDLEKVLNSSFNNYFFGRWWWLSNLLIVPIWLVDRCYDSIFYFDENSDAQTVLATLIARNINIDVVAVVVHYYRTKNSFCSRFIYIHTHTHTLLINIDNNSYSNSNELRISRSTFLILRM